MPELDLTIENIKSILTLSNSSINELLEQNPEGKFSLADFAAGIADTLQKKQSECVSLIKIFLKEREDLDLKGGYICKRNTSKPQKLGPVECALKYYPDIKDQISLIIDEELLQDRTDPIKIGYLTDKVASKLNLASYVPYHCIIKLVNEERKDLTIDKGRYGGLKRKKL